MAEKRIRMNVGMEGEAISRSPDQVLVVGVDINEQDAIALCTLPAHEPRATALGWDPFEGKSALAPPPSAPPPSAPPPPAADDAAHRHEETDDPWVGGAPEREPGVYVDTVERPDGRWFQVERTYGENHTVSNRYLGEVEAPAIEPVTFEQGEEVTLIVNTDAYAAGTLGTVLAVQEGGRYDVELRAGGEIVGIDRFGGDQLAKRKEEGMKEQATDVKAEKRETAVQKRIRTKPKPPADKPPADKT